MANTMTPGRYIPANSPLHRLDSRTKMLSGTLLILAAFAFHTPLPQIAFLGLLFTLIPAARLPLRAVWRGLLPVVPVMVLTFVLNAVAAPGKAARLFGWEIGVVSHMGFVRGLLLSMRLGSVALIASLLTQTTSPLEFSDGLHKLLSPLRRMGLPVGELALALIIALRFVPIFFDEANRLHGAQTARGAHFSGGVLRRIQSVLPLLIPLFVSAFGRAERLASALETRGFRADARRTAFRPLAFSLRDGLAVLATTGALMVSIYHEQIWTAIFV